MINHTEAEEMGNDTVEAKQIAYRTTEDEGTEWRTLALQDRYGYVSGSMWPEFISPDHLYAILPIASERQVGIAKSRL